MKSSKKKGFRNYMKKYWQLYAMLLPAMIGMIVFHYIPMYGLTLAFKDIRIGEGIFGGEWIGFYHFERFFSSNLFTTIFKNTFIIAIIQNFLLLPLPIVLALLLHNAGSRRLAKTAQTATYLPHLLSMVVLVSVIELFCSRETGLINIVLSRLGLEEIYFMGESQYFLPVYMISHVWATLGSGAVVYIAALSAVDPQLIEAAKIDGAGKLRRIWHIDLPTIRPTIIMLLIMNMGKVFTVGYEQILLMQNEMNLDVTEIIGTYVYKTGIVSAQYGFSTAVSLFNNVLGLILVLITNKLAKKFTESSLF